MAIRSVFAFLVLLISLDNVSAQTCPVIPRPVKAVRAAGQLPLSAMKRISVQDARLLPVAHFFQKELLKHTGKALSIGSLSEQRGAVMLAISTDERMPEEAYEMSITPDGVRILASTPHGVFNGVVSLLQLARIAAGGEDHSIPCWKISDAPQLSWRGVMLDESRHFFGKETVRDILDWMAFYKLDRFHWHLTDVPGWRLEIKAFPLLTVVGGIGNHNNRLAPATYYTQDDINEIVAYAHERFIEVIPEIDMPGHARAANRAYPQYSGGGSSDHPDFTFNPGKDDTYGYLSAILREVDVLFPSKMIHIGGDEVDYGNEMWKTDADVRRLMKENHLADLKAVERYFTRRMADSVMQLGAKVLGWDEIASSGIPASNTIIFWWRHNKPEALKEAVRRGYDIVMCPRIPFYFDFVQDSSHLVGRRWSGRFSDLQTVFHYSTHQYRDILGKDRRGQVLGFQANLWTETVSSRVRLEYMLFPRMLALAESAWTNDSDGDYSEFVDTRLPLHEKLLKEAGLHYYNPASPASTPEIIR